MHTIYNNEKTNKQTNKQAALTFFPYALLCPCCVLGANASLLQEEEPLYQSAADNACLRALCAYTCIMVPEPPQLHIRRRIRSTVTTRIRRPQPPPPGDRVTGSAWCRK